MQLLALVLVPPPGRGSAPRRLILVGAGGQELCALEAPYVPWQSAQCQVVGEHVMCQDEMRNALQVLDVRSGEIEYIDPELEDEEARTDFLAYPSGGQIVWSTTDLEVNQADVPEGTSRCRVTITQADGSEARGILEERYDNLYHLMPVTWTPGGDPIFFARMDVSVESAGVFIPAFSGCYSELYRLDLASDQFQKVFPCCDEAVCNRCIGDLSPEGQWLAYHREDGSLILQDLVSE